MLKNTPQELCILLAFNLLLPQCLLILKKINFVTLETSPNVDPLLSTSLFPSDQKVHCIMSPQNKRFHCSHILMESFLLPFICIIAILPCHCTYKWYCVYRLIEALGNCIKLCDKGRESIRCIVCLFSLPHQDDDEDQENSQQLILLRYVKTRKVEFATYMIVKTRPIFFSRDDLMRYAYGV